MPRVDLLQTNFSAGELSPRLYGRPDLAKYNDAVKRARDVVLLQHGGARGRPGTDYLGEVKTSANATRLIPFVFSRDDAYIVEAGNLYFRFWKLGAQITGPYEIASPYTSAQIFDVDFTQGADTMFMVHPDVAPQRLQRFQDTRWVIAEAPFDPSPFDEIGHRFGTTATLSAATVGSGRTITAAVGVFLASDVGRRITCQGGRMLVTGYTSATVLTGTIETAFASTALGENDWPLLGSPQTACTPSAKDPVGASITLTLAADGWRATDVGRFVQINGGLCKITGFTSATIVDARVEAVLAATVAAPADSWTLEGAVWNQFDGYPSTVTLHEQRLVFGCSEAHPQTIWGSRSGLFLDFTKGTLDDDAYSFELGTDEVNPIQFLSSGRDLMALTYGGEWTLTGGVEKPITPTNVRARPQAKVGAAAVRPEQVGDDLYYVQRGVSVLRTLGYQVELGGYESARRPARCRNTWRAAASAPSRISRAPSACCGS